jgi:hypoxanthine phosphoribosyltransferase
MPPPLPARPRRAPGAPPLAGVAATDFLARPRHITTTHVVPAQWRADLREVLVTEAQIKHRVAELARAVTRDYVGRELLVVPLLTGTLMFLADLLRRLSIPLKLDFIGVSSYREGAVSRELVFTKDLRLEARGRHVLLVDDILDTGRTLAAVRARLDRLEPASLRICVLLDKPNRRVEPVQADYTGFVIPDLFVVGYGLDYAERYRNLPFVGVLRPDLYRDRA